MRIFGHRQKKREVIYKDRMSSLLFGVFVVLLILLALNISLLLPPQLSTIFYMLELMMLQHLNYYVALQRWELYVLFIFFASAGYYLLPALYAPSINLSRFYYYTWVEGDTRFFRTLTGYVQISKDAVERKGFRWTVVSDVSSVYEGNVLVLQTKALEVTESNIWKRLATALAGAISDREDIIRKGTGVLTTEDVQRIMLALRGGGDEK